jgi:osmotically-inducible protein OsmY
VAPSFNPPRARRPPRKPTDAELQQTLRAALDAGAAVEDERITVAVVGGVATLKGSVPTLAARRRVRRVAENTVGVTEVRDQIRVKPPNAVSDKELVERTRAALAQAPRLSALELQVAASAGVVSLVGTVPRHGLRVRVERAVSRIPGVKAIASRLRVPPPETPRRDVSIRRTLRRTLRWSARLDEERIRFQVRRGKVRLEGSVDSIGQRNELTRIARGAGAVEVENRLAIGLP